MPPPSTALTPLDYLLMARRRAGLLVGVMVASVVIGLLLSAVLPRTYRSAGVILIESQQISSALLPEAVGGFAAEKVQVVAQRVMTRENLLAIDGKYGLSVGADRDGADAAVETLRGAISVTPVTGTDGRSANLAFEVAFEASEARLAHDVANELVTLFLSENARIRRRQAADATDFLEREASKLEAELNLLDQKLASYKEQYADALPEHLELRMGMLQRLESEDKALERESRATQEELRFLDVELAAAQAGVTGDDATAGNGPLNPRSLAALEREYSALRTEYTDRYPEVIRLAGLIRERRARGDTGLANTEGSLRVARVEAQINSAGGRLESLQSQRARLQEELEKLQAQIILTPQVQRELTNITRDYANARAKYEEVREKQIDASIRQTMVEENIADHFSLLEAPVVAAEPASPDPRKVLLAAVFGGALVAAGLLVLLEGLDPRVAGAHAVERLLRAPPLAVIPPLGGPGAPRRARGLRRGSRFAPMDGAVR